jgi:hypothetical protein
MRHCLIMFVLPKTDGAAVQHPGRAPSFRVRLRHPTLRYTVRHPKTSTVTVKLKKILPYTCIGLFPLLEANVGFTEFHL